MKCMEKAEETLYYNSKGLFHIDLSVLFMFGSYTMLQYVCSVLYHTAELYSLSFII